MAQEAFSIITYGGGEALDIVFNAIASIFKSGEFNNALFITATLCGFCVILQTIAKNAAIIPAKYFVWFVLITQLMLWPRATVMVIDPLLKYERTVHNVPWILGAFASVISNVGDVLTKEMEKHFSIPDPLKYHINGTLFASKLFTQMRQYKVHNADLRANLHRFVQNCVVYDAMVGYKYTLKDLQESQDILSLVSDTSPIVGFTYQKKGEESKIVTCKVGINLLKADLNNEVPVVAGRLGAKFGLRKLFMSDGAPTMQPIVEEVSPTGVNDKVNNAIKAEFLGSLMNSYDFMTKISKSGEEILKQGIMINAIQDASKAKVEELGLPQNYATTKALMQQRSHYQTGGQIAAQVTAVIKVVFEVLAYSSFIFVAIMALMPHGFTILINYFGLLVWIQLWAPMYAVLNLVMNIAGRYQSSSQLGEQGLSMLTTVGFSNMHADMEALAGYLSVSLLYISYAIVKGGVGTFMNLSSALSSGSNAALVSAASEVTSGNMSMGNVSYANSSLHNFNGFKHDSNTSFHSGRMEMMHEDGSIGFMTPSGRVGFKGGAGITSSSWEQQLNVQSSLSATAQAAEQNESTRLASLNHEYSESKGVVMRSATDFLQRMNQSGNASGSWSVGGSTDQVVAASQTKSFMQELQNRHGYSEAQAAEVAAGVGLGMDSPVKVSASTNWRSQSDYQEAINKGQQVADSMGVTESLSKTLRHSDNFAFSENELYEQGLAKNISSGIDQMKGLRDSIGVSEQKLHRISFTKSQIESGAITLNTDMSQRVVEEIANTPSRGVWGGEVGKIGENTASKIIRMQDPESQMIVRGAMERVMHKEFENISAGIDMKSDYGRDNTVGDIGLQEPRSQVIGYNNNEHERAVSNINSYQHPSDPLEKGSMTSFDSTEKDSNANNKMTLIPEAIASNKVLQPESEQKERGLAEDAKAWEGRDSRFVDNKKDGLSPYVNVEKKVGGVIDAIPSVPKSLEGMDISRSSYGDLRKGMSEQYNIQKIKKDTDKVFENDIPNFTGKLKDNIDTNLKALSKTYKSENAPFKATMISEVDNKIDKALEPIVERTDKIVEKESKLQSEYTESRGKTKLDKAIGGVTREEKE